MEEKVTSKSNALRLPGATPKGVYSFRDHRGNLLEDGMHTVFPIVKQVEGGDIQLIGTGFFIAGNGVFATAKHVLCDVLDENGQQTFPIGIFHFFPDDQFIIRPEEGSEGRCKGLDAGALRGHASMLLDVSGECIPSLRTSDHLEVKQRPDTFRSRAFYFRFRMVALRWV